MHVNARIAEQNALVQSLFHAYIALRPARMACAWREDAGALDGRRHVQGRACLRGPAYPYAAYADTARAGLPTFRCAAHAIRLSKDQRERIVRAFASVPPSTAHAWARRHYAPMHIHDPAFRSLKHALQRRWPEHEVTFDVVFEAPPDRCVEFHSDYESLGPFAYHPFRSVARHDFLSVHFNLTPDGGCLRTLDWPLLSWVHHRVILAFGIYSAAHRLLNALCAPLFRGFARTHPNTPDVGNAFDNLRLHSVSAGDARLSYVRGSRKGVRGGGRPGQRGAVRGMPAAGGHPPARPHATPPSRCRWTSWSTGAGRAPG